MEKSKMPNNIDHKKIEEELKKSEQQYRTLVQTIPDIIYELDVDGTFAFVSDGVKELGYTSERLVGKHFGEIIHPDDFESVSSSLVLPKHKGKKTGDARAPKLFDERRTEKRITRNLEVRLLVGKEDAASKDYRYAEIYSTGKFEILEDQDSQNHRHAEVHSSGKWDRDIKEESNKFLGSIGIIRDVTDRKKAEESLRQSEQFNSTLFEYNPIETIVVDLEGKVVRFNLAQKRSISRVPGIGDLMYKDYAGNHEIDMRGELMKCINSGKGKEFPEQLYGDRFLFIRISPFPHGAVIASQDITRRKKTEEELKNVYTAAAKAEKEKAKAAQSLQKRVAELEKAYAEIEASKDEMIRTEKLAHTGRIAASIAHEVRNPLTNLTMSIRQLGKGIKPESSKAKYIEIIERNTERINYLITELLNCARPPKLDMQPHNIHRVLENVLESVMTKIKSKRIKVVKRFTSEKSIIGVDKELVERVFLNIVINAIEAMSRAGKLIIITEVNQDLFGVKIQDNGQGINQKDIIKIFDPFFSTKSGGIGLGLTLCYGIIVSHGGTIEVESEPKKGTIFTVSLPADHK